MQSVFTFKGLLKAWMKWPDGGFWCMSSDVYFLIGGWFISMILIYLLHPVFEKRRIKKIRKENTMRTMATKIRAKVDWEETIDRLLEMGKHD